ncbi:MAG: ABC transporter permease subunit [Phycisphaeraceae bacterium]|nr:MAG: ABC transporter permease subunit [Phycisphaeraceae bacterium]
MPVILRWLLRLGPTNPIAVRLVQNGSRRTRHMLIRSGYLAALIIVLLWLILAKAGSGDLDYRTLAAVGASSFTFIAYLQIALICVIAPVFMAGAIAQEASPRTWEVLLTTPLGPLEIVLGNLLGRLFFILALLFASLPLFALTQYFGGVPGKSIFASYLIAATAALVVGSIAIALAVSRVVGKRSVFFFYVAVVTYLAVTIGLDSYLRNSGINPNGQGVTILTAFNPFLALRAMLSPSSYPTAPLGTFTGIQHWLYVRPVATSNIGGLILSLFLLIASTITVRAGGLQTIGSGASGIPLHRRIFRLGAKGAEHRPPRTPWANPIAWREAAARNASLPKSIARWSFIALGGLFGLGLVFLYHSGSMAPASFQLALLTTVTAELGVITLLAITMAATAVTREREDGTLDLLLTTPITPSAYLTGKLRGLIAYLLPLLAVPLGTVAFASLYALTGGLGREDGAMITSIALAKQFAHPIVLPEAALILPIVVVPFIAFCAIVGLHWSLKSKGTLGSVVASVGIVAAVSAFVGLCGWRAGSEFALLGPALAGLSPGSALFATINPADMLSQTISSHDLTTARVALAIGCFISAGAYIGIVYAVHAALVKNFDMTVRKLAGVK